MDINSRFLLVFMLQMTGISGPSIIIYNIFEQVWLIIFLYFAYSIRTNSFNAV